MRRWGYYTLGFFNLSAKNVFVSVAFASYSVVAKTVLVGRVLAMEKESHEIDFIRTL